MKIASDAYKNSSALFYVSCSQRWVLNILIFKMNILRSSETSVTLYTNTQRDISKHLTLHLSISSSVQLDSLLQ